ncbi:hypothetical protein GCM10017044_13490 [Kordiimonas sediminis]|uniref:Mucoidy inhibitor MuiA family protein n=1 Tax=Kordiimonas sediminis TaxID=1735581 RepID=A0A919E522_9PROT|nr:mucoidy inhibitor MuiA family protein [Kordiimonas sediminis]GHF20013.1 hypothetical protein GCM10017044_13490 [Kordiimonas sediminis]
MSLRSTLVASAAVIALTAAVTADDFTVQAPIKSVTLYQNGAGATVHRTGQINLPAGTHTITVDGLLSDFDMMPGLLGSGLTLIAEEREVYYKEPSADNEAARSLDAAIKAKKQEIAVIADAIAAADMQLQYIGSLSAPGKEGSAPATAENMQAILALIGTGAKSVQAEKRDLLASKEKRDAELKVLMQSRDKYSLEEQEFQKVIMTAHAAQPTTATVNVAYEVRDAGWTQQVHARLDTNTGKIVFDVWGALEQDTEEDWMSVDLSLNSRRPDSRGQIYLPPPSYVSIGTAEEMLRRAEMKYSSAPAADLEEAMAIVPPIAVMQSDFGTSLTFPDKFTLRSSIEDSQLKRLMQFEEEAELVIQSAPEMQGRAFVTARLVFGQDTTFSAGQARVIRDGTSLGSFRWPALVKGEEVELPVGGIDTIQIKSIQEQEDDGTSGIFSRSGVNEFKKRFEVRNTGQQARVVEIFASVPTARNEDISVKPLRSATDASDTNFKGQPGLYMWRKSVAPGETWVINHHYQVSAPKDARLEYSRN